MSPKKSLLHHPLYARIAVAYLLFSILSTIATVFSVDLRDSPAPNLTPPTGDRTMCT
jgi:hypothetical protein